MRRTNMERYINQEVFRSLYLEAMGRETGASVANVDPRPKLDELVAAAEKGDNRRIALWCKSPKPSAGKGASGPGVLSSYQQHMRNVEARVFQEAQMMQQMQAPQYATATAMGGVNWGSYSMAGIASGILGSTTTNTSAY